MTDLNTAIALSKGYKFGQPVSGMNRDIWYETFPDSGWFETKCPDYEHDARLYMALFEEMPRPALRKWGNRWYCMPDMDRSSKVQWVEYDADTIGTAICIAYAKWKGIEVVG